MGRSQRTGGHSLAADHLECDIDGLKAEDKTGDGGNYSTGQGEANNDYSADGGAI